MFTDSSHLARSRQIVEVPSRTEMSAWRKRVGTFRVAMPPYTMPRRVSCSRVEDSAGYKFVRGKQVR